MTGRIARWGLAAVVCTLVLTLAAGALTFGGVESRLNEQAAARLADAGAGWAGIQVSGRRLVLTGTAPSEEARTAARAALDEVWGVAAIEDRTALVELVSPFVWSAAKAGDTLRLTGNIPDDALRVTLREAAGDANPDHRVVDETTVARGAPPGMAAAARFALTLLAFLEDGTATLTDDRLAVDGTARDGERYEAARDLVAAGAEPAVTIADARILPPRLAPYVWTLRVDPGVAQVEGATPDEAVAETLFAAAAVLAPRPIDDRTVLASGAPPGFEAAASFALRAGAFLSTGTVVIQDAAIALSGRPASVGAGEALAALIAAESPAGFSVDPSGLGAALVETFVWEARRTATGVELTGHTPSEEAQVETRATASQLFGEAAVADRTGVAAGEPGIDWIGALDFALGELALLAEGQVSVSGNGFSIAGTAGSPEAFAQLDENLRRTLPASLVLAAADIRPPAVTPYRFEAMAEQDRLILTGYFPDAAARAARLEGASAALPGLVPDDRTLPASGAPPGFEVAASAALAALGRLSGGRAILADRRLVVDGEAASPGAAASVAAALRAALPADFELVSAVTAVPTAARVAAAECTALIVAMLADGGVQFDRGDAAIAPASMPVLDRVAATLDRCADTRIEVAGYTDSNGPQQANRELSQRRAEAVVAFLVADGIAPERLAAAGYGESRPIASNRTEEGRGQNRRIEFVLTAPGGGDAVRP